MGKTVLLFCIIDDLSLKIPSECCYQIDGNASYGYGRKKVSEEVFASSASKTRVKQIRTLDK